jgi:hypothetical protein
VIFTISIALLLIGLTNKGLVDEATRQLHDWTDPSVGGLILAGGIGILLFIWAEWRAKEPIIPLGLFRNRTYSSSMASSFFAAFAFFGAIVFLPRWFQVVHNYSPTYSGLAALPLVIGLIFSSIVSGLIVARTGRYKWLLVGAITLIGVATLFMTQLNATTPVPVVWLWMFLAGLGVGPTFSVFTIVVQNAVPFSVLGVATSNLTFFRQIGGTVALSFVGTIFATSFQEDLPKQMVLAGVPQNVLNDFFAAVGTGKIDFNVLTGVGGIGQAVIAAVPSAAPVIDAIVLARNAAFSLAVSQTFWLGVFGSAVAVVAALAMEEHALRTSNAEPAPASVSGRPAADRPAVPEGTAPAVTTTDRPIV